jgi:hypothetical protein
MKFIAGVGSMNHKSACAFCAEELQDAAVVCRDCQRDMASAVTFLSTLAN